MSTVAVGTVESLTDETPPVFKDLSGSREIVQGVWAWAHFDGSTNVIADSFNVTSLTDNGTGDYTFTFSTALPNANYAMPAMAGQVGSSILGGWVSPYTTKSTTQLRIEVSTWSTNRILIDLDDVSFAVFCNP